MSHRAQETVRMLAFDCLVVDDQNVMSRTLDKRYGVSDRVSRILDGESTECLHDRG